MTKISDATRRILTVIIDAWSDASAAESDPREHAAFAEAIGVLEKVETHEDLRRAASVCWGYPTWTRRTVLDLADAERDGRKVQIFEREDGVRWEIEPAVQP